MGKIPQWMGNRTFCREIFIGCWESDEGYFWLLKPFSKLKTRLCKYWTSIKIKISMTCVCKEYEIKINWSNDYRWKWSSYWIATWKLLFSGEGLNGEIFPGGEEWAHFRLLGGFSPIHLSSENLVWWCSFFVEDAVLKLCLFRLGFVFTLTCL